jgi:hypothetical protein
MDRYYIYTEPGLNILKHFITYISYYALFLYKLCVLFN